MVWQAVSGYEQLVVAMINKGEEWLCFWGGENGGGGFIGG